MVDTAIDEALAAGADLIVLPELVTSGYVFESAAEVRALALSSRSESFQDWSSRLGTSDAIVVGGYPELGADGLVYNSVAVVDRSGLLANYRKAHLWDDEKRWFTPGGDVPPVIDTRLGRLGVLICYDLEFPEIVRHLALRGADLIAVPTNWPYSPRPVGERPGEMLNVMAAARLNRVFVACADRVGSERGVEWNGGSCVVDVDGWIVAERHERDAGIVVADVDVSLARDKSLNSNNDVLADRRPDLYCSVVEPPVVG
jgi:5-aminopentanamidase